MHFYSQHFYYFEEKGEILNSRALKAFSSTRHRREEIKCIKIILCIRLLTHSLMRNYVEAISDYMHKYMSMSLYRNTIDKTKRRERALIRRDIVAQCNCNLICQKIIVSLELVRHRHHRSDE